MRMPAELGTFHIIGIGGIGMSAIAEILLAKGYSVQGSDQKDSANVRRLRAKGVRVFIGHDPINLVGARQVVISTAVKSGNPELEAARQKRLVIIRRAEMLAELMRLHATISITGTHGKTTTSSLVAQMFEAAGKDPTVITGGIINAWGSNARLGEGSWMIVEADESDGTFTRLPTEIGVVTNIDPEHLDYFGSVGAMHREYEAFMRNVPFYGLLVACIDHPVVREMVERLNLRHDGRRLLTYGTRQEADFVLANVSQSGHVTTFDAQLSARVAGSPRVIERLELPMPGHHNALNALAAVAVAVETGLDDDMVRNGLRAFSGVRRRFQPTGTWNGISFFDDYGHHPTEIAAVLQAARAGAKGRVIAIVEPHRYTRVRDLFDEFSNCFKDADGVVVGPLYTAGEQPIEGIDNHALAEGIRATGQQGVLVVDSPTELIGIVRKHGRPGDMVICMGAGTSTEWAQALPGWLEDEHTRMAGE